MLNLNYLKNSVLILYLFIYLIFPNLAIAQLKKIDMVKDLENALNSRDYKYIDNNFINMVKLVYMLPGLHHSGGTLCEPVDLPVTKRHLEMIYAHIRYSDKPFMGSVTEPERAEDSVEMCKLLFGKNFRILFGGCIFSNGFIPISLV